MPSPSRKPPASRPPIVKMPESAFFEDKAPAAGDRRRWTRVPAVVAACCVFLVFAGLAYTSTYFVADEATAARIAEVTRISPPTIVLVQWRPGGYHVLVLPAGGEELPTVEHWLIDPSGEATLVRQLIGDPRAAQRVSRAIGYGGAVLSGMALAGMIGSRLRRPRGTPKQRYTPPVFKP